MALTQATIGATETTIRTAVGNEAITSIHFCNFDTVNDEVITVHARIGGAAAANGNTIIKELTIPAGDTYVWSGDEKFILSATDVISAIATTGSRVSTTISYITI